MMSIKSFPVPEKEKLSEPSIDPYIIGVSEVKFYKRFPVIFCRETLGFNLHVSPIHVFSYFDFRILGDGEKYKASRGDVLSLEVVFLAYSYELEKVKHSKEKPNLISVCLEGANFL